MRVIRVLSLITVIVALSAAASLAQTPAATADKPAAKNPNPELVGELATELGATQEQAAGAAGSLFSLAKTRLKPEEWTKVAGAVPGMDGLLKAAPAGAIGTSGANIPGASAITGNLGGLAAAAGAFQKLGLKPDLVLKAVPVLTKYVEKIGGAEVAKLLAGVLK
jgi:Protein of unknown function VcgC/VcgE (DUF2780)